MSGSDLLQPGDYSITINQGATFELGVAYLDSDGNAVNMTAYAVAAQLWNRTGTAKIANFETPWDVQASGSFKLRLSAAVTSGITEQGQYDVLVTEPSGDKFYLLEGTAFLNPGLSGKGV